MALQRRRHKTDATKQQPINVSSDRANKKLIKNLQDSLNVLREQLARLNKMITDTQSEMHNISKQVGDLQQYTEDLDTRKADVIYVDAQLLKKADKIELSDLVGRPEFVDVNREVHKLIEDLFSKLTLSEEEIRNLINALEEGLQVKLDRDEFDQLREWLEKRFKALAVRVRSIHSVSPVIGVPPVTQISDEAAGLRRGLMQHYHCISCDRPLQIPIGLDTSIPYVESRGFPSSKSIRPYTTFELDGFRQHFLSSGSNIYDIYGVARRCGGTHTTMHAFKRVNRSNTGKSTIYDEEINRSLPYLSPREEINLEGYDGHIYRGRLITQDVQNQQSSDDVMTDEMDPNKLPPIPRTGVISAKCQEPLNQHRSRFDQSPKRTKSIGSMDYLNRQPSSVSRSNGARKVQLVQPNTRSPDCLVANPEGYAVIVMPTTNDTKDESPDEPNLVPPPALPTEVGVIKSEDLHSGRLPNEFQVSSPNPTDFTVDSNVKLSGRDVQPIENDIGAS